MSLGMQMLGGLFLPLFPLSLVLNRGLARLRHPYQRALLIILWPQLGVLLVTRADAPVPAWLAAWALATALLYAYRAIALRDLGLWIAFLATSAWALLWLSDSSPGLRHLEALGLSAPLVLLTLLGGGLEALVGAVSTWTGLGLASTAPRYAAVLVLGVLASIATPLSPGFITLAATLADQAPGAPALAVGVALVWLLWSWSGARLIQGLVVGPGGRDRIADLSLPMAWVYGLAVAGLGLAGISLAGALL